MTNDACVASEAAETIDLALPNLAPIAMTRRHDKALGELKGTPRELFVVVPAHAGMGFTEA
ncbi:hypothetical protein [Lysobacter antibioticus]|uniref:hypothetical protein n=1 Tax=Lysobacter antibioticus TaxID=84531 RepID=UPI000B2EF09F|nr:hypothetical protein [Lysobacter antibioticus]